MLDYGTLPIMEKVIHSPQSSLSAIQAPYYGIIHENEAASTTSLSRISPYILLFIVILAVIFFVSGFVHLLLRFLKKGPSSSFVFHSNRYPDQSSGPPTFQRQLQQLFRLHDSGLDQAFIDALPVFCYKDVSGLKEQFDCAVCLCEFTEEDKLRLLPICSHAFHIDCIDTWLLSNSTCPLCRRTLSSSNFENQIYNLGNSSQPLSTRFQDEGGNDCPDNQKPEGSTGELFLSVRLGKFRNSDLQNNIEIRLGKVESSSSHLDGRRCFSMGAYQYVVSDSNLHVVLGRDGCVGGRSLRRVELTDIPLPEDETTCGKRVGARTRDDSFSLSKVWLWANKSKLHSSSSTLMCIPSSVDYSK